MTIADIGRASSCLRLPARDAAEKHRTSNEEGRCANEQGPPQPWVSVSHQYGPTDSKNERPRDHHRPGRIDPRSIGHGCGIRGEAEVENYKQKEEAPNPDAKR